MEKWQLLKCIIENKLNYKPLVDPQYKSYPFMLAWCKYVSARLVNYSANIFT